MARNYLVVGDKFETYAQLDECISFSELQDKLERANFIKDIEEGDRYYPGQGILAEQIQTFIESIEAKGISDYFSNWYSACALFKAKKKLTHKHKASNTLVTEPIRLGSNTFELKISIDGNNEFLNDHVTGFHLQGMLLIEAARQASMAVTKKFFLPKATSWHHYFVVHTIRVDFLSFAFPIDSKIICKIIDSDMTNPLKLSFNACIEIHQINVVVTTINFTFTLYQRHDIERKERWMAKKSLKHHLECLSYEPQILTAVNNYF